MDKPKFTAKPEWLRVPANSGEINQAVMHLMQSLDLHTVCEEAGCPNCGECFGRGTATFLILGRECTRNCTFCSVIKGTPDCPDPFEPDHLAEAVVRLALRYVVITSVTRDDLPDGGSEDIHMFVESELTRRIGDAGKRLHTGRSRNDQVALDIRLYLRDACAGLRAGMIRLCTVLLDLSESHLDTVLPGYTHLQRAQPVTLAHHLMAYVEMVRRDVGRLDDALCRLDAMPLGSGALAGTTYPLDRVMVARELGFSAITRNSLDGVSDRDFVIEIAACLSIFMMHLSRLSEEIILWSSQEFRFIELDDAFSTGSSIMPQKKNPDVAELTRGKTGRVIGSLVTLLTVMKELPLAYNKDMREDKEAIFDAVGMCLPAFTGMLETMNVRKENMRETAQSGFTNATDLADYLVGKGLPFRDVHEVFGKLVRLCSDTGRTLESLPLETLRMYSPLFDADVYGIIDIKACVDRRSLAGGPAMETVAAALIEARKSLGL